MSLIKIPETERERGVQNYNSNNLMMQGDENWPQNF